MLPKATSRLINTFRHKYIKLCVGLFKKKWSKLATTVSIKKQFGQIEYNDDITLTAAKMIHLTYHSRQNHFDTKFRFLISFKQC